MKLNFLLLLVVFFGLNTFAQITFEKGFIIDDSGKKTVAWIKNKEWKNNPSEFEYRLFEQGDVLIGDLTSIKEFGNGITFKYEKHVVKMDRVSRNNVNDIKEDARPVYLEENLFLKTLVDGDAKLYSYVEGSLIRYFYKNNKSAVNQLIHYKYRTRMSDDQVYANDIIENNGFRGQLWNDMRSECIGISTSENLGYYKQELIDYVRKYNECLSVDTVVFESNKDKNSFHLNLRPGILFSSLSIEHNLIDSQNIDFGNNTNMRLGLEAEYVLPFNKNKWSVFLEPTYRQFKTTKEVTYLDTSTITKTTTAEVSYKSIELPLGLRYYSFLKNKSKLFFNAAMVYDFSFDSYIDFEKSNMTDLEIDTSKKVFGNLALGAGYKYANKYSLELRYGFKSYILNNYLLRTSDYSSFSIVVGYDFF